VNLVHEIEQLWPVVQQNIVIVVWSKIGEGAVGVPSQMVRQSQHNKTQELTNRPCCFLHNNPVIFC